MKKSLLLLTVIFAFAQTYAVVRYVKPDATSTAWAHITDQGLVYTSLGSAQNASVSGDEIWVAGGLYEISSITMQDGINLYGGFHGTENLLTERQKSDLDNNGMVEAWEYTAVTTIKGSGTGRVVSTTSTAGYYVAGVAWEGVTITNGGGTGSGRGVFLAVKTALKNCIISENHGAGTTGSVYAGAIQNKGGLVESCLIENNTTTSSDPTTPAIYGAGIATTDGGIIKNSVVRNNKSLVDSNVAFNDNYNNMRGGGIFLNKNGIAINCVVYNNESGNGAGVYINNQAPTDNKLINCTIVNNKSANIAGGLYAYDCGSIYNNIIWNNLAGDGTGTSNNVLLNHTTINGISFDYNAYNGGLDGDANNTVTTPVVYTLDDLNTGGTVPANFITITNFQGVAIDAAQKLELSSVNWNLNNGSACVNVGNNAMNSESYDILGNDRVINTTIDLGAYETSFFPTAIGDDILSGAELYFPNPAKDYLNLDERVEAVSFYDISGKMVKECTQVNDAVEISELPAGLYLISIKLNNGSVKTEKLLKK